MKKCKNEKLYLFLTDKLNKSSIVVLLGFLLLMVLSIFIKSTLVRFLIYIILYIFINNFYDKVVDYLFRKGL